MYHKCVTIAKIMIKTNQDFISEQCIRYENGVLAVSDEDKKIAQKNYHEKLLNIVCMGQEQFGSGTHSQQCTLFNRQRHSQRFNQ